MPPPDDYTLHSHMGVTVVTLEVENLLGVIDVNRISGELSSLVNGGAKHLVLDLQHVKYAGSAALGMLLALSGELQARGGKLVLANPDHIAPLLRVTRASAKLQTAPNTLAAMEMFTP